ncbi:unnamed protein product [Symbiodinium sp. CCMP2592]|nr:unnamed protein product [Symbiodinium sp. CCMP2592]
MVTISHMVTLQYKEEKAIIVPIELIIQYEEHQYIQLRPTNHAICQLVCGSNIPKNASISACTKLQDIIQKRNQAMQSDEASEQKDDLFPSSDEPPSKKKKGLKILPPTVNITIGAIVDFIREDAIEAMQQSKRKYVKKAIMEGDMPLNSKTEAILAVLEHAGLASKQRLLPRHPLIHPVNRSQSMLSYHDVWSKGQAMSLVGFNVKVVEGTTIAFAISTEPEKRAMQLAKNKALIENAKGHLAPMTGSEGFLTIGGSYTVAYLRCIENGVAGPSAESSTHPKSDAIWRAISDGWTWVTTSSAVEVAMLLATCFGKGMTLAQAVKHAEAADVRCRPSISAIATFVQKFSGHAGTFPILHFLSNFSKVHSSSMLLGEDMMTQIATMDFKSSTNMHGFARNLIRSDIERLRMHGASINSSMKAKASTLTAITWTIALGLCIRTILHLCNKAKTGSKECKEFASLEAIVEAFSTELSKDSPASGAEASKSDEKPMVDVLSAKPHVVALLQNAHMTMGSHSYTNSKEDGSMASILQSVSDDGACMRHTPFFGDSIDITMVTISHMVTLQYKEEKAIIVPTELIIQYEEHQYIQLRPTNHAICQLVCGSNIPKNASISACTKLQDIIQKRNQAMQSDEASEQKDDLFPSSDEPPSKKKKGLKILPPTVNITIGAIVDFIREDAIEAMQQSKRKYVKKAIMEGDMPLNSKTEAILAVLEHAGLASKQRLLPRHPLIHPVNRSQSMLSYHDVWSKGQAMSLVGFNVKVVEGTTIAFAISTEPEKRAMQLAKNKALIENAKGHLAPMTGSEGFLTIGGSHTVAYLRCIENGVAGPSAESSTHPKSDAIWRAISDGWTWVTTSSAVEVAMLLATCFGKGMTLAQAVKHAEAADVRCRSSISAIATLVQKFSCHAGTFPILHFLLNFSKVHSSSMLLGEDMMTQIATMDFKSSTNMYPMTRAAIWLTLFACPKSHERDGFARNLIRSDIERLRQAACLPMTTKAGQMLQDAWGVHQFIHEGQGKHIAKTGSKECKEFASLEAIVEAFSTELSKDSPASGADLMTMVACKKKAGIKLTPVGNISKHKAEGAPKGTALEAFGSHWVVSPPKQNILFEDEKHPLVPYFWVRACASDAQPNMSFSTIVQDGVTVPMLYNEEPIDKHEVLLHPPMEETVEEPPKKAKAKAKANWFMP